MNNPLPLLGITGYSGSGKTTLLEKLLPQLIKKGLRVSVIKHSHHNAHVDKEGKDSWRMKEAGSAQVKRQVPRKLSWLVILVGH